MKIQVAAFCVVAKCSGMIGYQHFRGPFCLHLQKDNMVLCNVGILSHKYTASQVRRLQLHLNVVSAVQVTQSQMRWEDDQESKRF